AGSKRAEALKTLVKNNFDSFIEAKSRIDMLYEGMQSSSFNEAEEYGTRPFLTALDEATAYASRIYDPIMDRRMRAEKIQSTLSIIERYKFFFDLPHSLIEYAKQEKFDTAVREFKKGRSLLQSVASSTQRDGIGGQSSMGSAALKDLFDMVWKEVQQSVVVLRKALFRRLSQSWRPFDEQEKCIRYLFEISPGSDNPVAFYVENQHQWIMSQMAGHSDHYFRKVEALYGNSNSNGGTKNGGGDAGGLGYKGYGMWTAPDASPAAAAASLSKDEDNEVADPPLSTTPSPSQAQPLQQRDIASIFRRALELDWALEGSNNDGPLAFTHAKGKEHAHWRLISNA
ncbi:Exocyst complex component S5, partial [Spiromyces aspiralis]